MFYVVDEAGYAAEVADGRAVAHTCVCAASRAMVKIAEAAEVVEIEPAIRRGEVPRAATDRRGDETAGPWVQRDFFGGVASVYYPPKGRKEQGGLFGEL